MLTEQEIRNRDVAVAFARAPKAKAVYVQPSLAQRVATVVRESLLAIGQSLMDIVPKRKPRTLSQYKGGGMQHIRIERPGSYVVPNATKFWQAFVRGDGVAKLTVYAGDAATPDKILRRTHDNPKPGTWWGIPGGQDSPEGVLVVVTGRGDCTVDCFVTTK